VTTTCCETALTYTLGIDSLDSKSHRDRTAHESLKTTFGCPRFDLRELVLVVLSKPEHCFSEVVYFGRICNSYLGRLSTGGDTLASNANEAQEIYRI
jgi:hypothetical protein